MSTPLKPRDHVILFHGWNDTPKCAVIHYDAESKKLSLVESHPKCRVFHDVDAEKVRTLGPFERFMDMFTTYPEVDNTTIKSMSCKGRWPETTYPQVKNIAKSTSQEGRETGTKRDREKEIAAHIKHSNYTFVLDSDEDTPSLADMFHSDSKFRKFVDDAGAAKRNGQA